MFPTNYMFIGSTESKDDPDSAYDGSTTDLLSPSEVVKMRKKSHAAHSSSEMSPTKEASKEKDKEKPPGRVKSGKSQHKSGKKDKEKGDNEKKKEKQKKEKHEGKEPDHKKSKGLKEKRKSLNKRV